MGGGYLPDRQMLEDQSGEEAAIPHFRGAMVIGFKGEVFFHMLSARRKSWHCTPVSISQNS